jgi:hypothetical protein
MPDLEPRLNNAVGYIDASKEDSGAARKVAIVFVIVMTTVILFSVDLFCGHHIPQVPHAPGEHAPGPP